MKNRAIVLIIVVFLMVLYNQMSSTVEDFDLKALQKVRPAENILKIENYNDQVLVFWDDLGLDYFKTSPFGFKWVYGGSHSGDYEFLSSQYLPKSGLRDFAIVFGEIHEAIIDDVKVQYEGNLLTAKIIETEDRRIWYVVIEEEVLFFDVIAYSDEIVKHKIQHDESWMETP